MKLTLLVQYIIIIEDDNQVIINVDHNLEKLTWLKVCIMIPSTVSELRFGVITNQKQKGLTDEVDLAISNKQL